MIYVGIDWADKNHSICILDTEGNKLAAFEIAHSQQGFEKAHAQIGKHALSVDQVGIAIETRDSLFVDFLSELGYTLYFLNPKQTDSFRDRHRMSRSKSDSFDAYVLADALRTDQPKFNSLSPLDEQSLLLRVLCRTRVNAVERKTSIQNELIAALKRYYPVALELFSSLDHPVTIAFLKRYTTYPKAKNVSHGQIVTMFKNHGFKEHCAQERARIIKEKLIESQPIPAASVAHAQTIAVESLLRQFESIILEIENIDAQIKKIYTDHTNKEIIESLPGVAAVLGPVITSELGADITRYASLKALRAYAGTSPVTESSGKFRGVHFRRACNQPLRRALHLAAATAIRTSSWARKTYDRLKAAGKTHGRALRAVADQLIEMLFVMLTKRTLYDESYHLRMQQQHSKIAENA